MRGHIHLQQRFAGHGGRAGFDVLVTADKNMRNQQNLTPSK
jgi:hypothetical protein